MVSTIVPDGFGAEQERAAATVSYGLLVGIIKSEASLGYKPLENAIAAARTYSKDIDIQVAKAFVNVGALLAEQVSGKVSTELDPRLAHDADGLVAKAKTLAGLYKDVGIPKDKILFRLPATFEGIKATKELEKSGLSCHVFMVYSLSQATAAAEAGASVINPNIGRTRDFFIKNPNMIRNPKGPRQDAGIPGGIDPGIQLAVEVYNYLKCHYPKTAVMATGIRSREDALALAGYDFLVLPPPVIETMKQTTTISGYNDGLQATEPIAEGVMPRVVSPQNAKAANPEKVDTKDVMSNTSSFEQALGMAGKELLSAGLASSLKDVQALASLSKATSGNE